MEGAEFIVALFPWAWIFTRDQDLLGRTPMLPEYAAQCRGSAVRTISKAHPGSATAAEGVEAAG